MAPEKPLIVYVYANKDTDRRARHIPTCLQGRCTDLGPGCCAELSQPESLVMFYCTSPARPCSFVPPIAFLDRGPRVRCLFSPNLSRRIHTVSRNHTVGRCVILHSNQRYGTCTETYNSRPLLELIPRCSLPTFCVNINLTVKAHCQLRIGRVGHSYYPVPRSCPEK